MEEVLGFWRRKKGIGFCSRNGGGRRRRRLVWAWVLEEVERILGAVLGELKQVFGELSLVFSHEKALVLSLNSHW